MEFHQGGKHRRVQRDREGVVLVRGDVTAGPLSPGGEKGGGAGCEVTQSPHGN